MSNPNERPNFSQILPDLEKHLPSEERRNFHLINQALTLYDTLSDNDEAVMDLEEEFLSDEEICVEQKIVSKLKNRWEQLSVENIKGKYFN